MVKNSLTIVSVIFLFYSCGDKQSRDVINSDTESTLLIRANDFYNKDNYVQSKKCFDTLVSINNKNGEYYFKRGFSNYMIDAYNEAIIDFMVAIDLNYERKHSAYLNIGTINRLKGKYDSAIYYYNRALAIVPSYEKAKREKEEVMRIIESRDY